MDYELSSLMNDLINMIKTKLDDKGLLLNLEFDKNTPERLHGDEIRIKQIYSLAPGSKYKNYSVFVVRKPIKGKAGSVYPWFDEPGMATQVLLPSPVKDLLADGSLERIVYR